MKKPLWVRWYSTDILGSGRVARMTRDEEYLYRRLLDYQAADGFIEPDPRRLAFACKMTPDEFAHAWSAIRDCFERLETGRFSETQTERFANARMSAERERSIAAQDSARENGKRGGRPKKADEKPAGYPGGSLQETGRVTGSKPGGKANREPRAESREETQTPPRAAEPRRAKPPGSGADAPVPSTAEPIDSSPTPEQPAAKPPRKAPTGPHAELIAWWVTAWHEARGTDWAVTGKDGAAAKRLLALTKGDLAAIKARGDRMLCSTNRWHAERASLAHLASQWNELGVEILPAQVNGSGGNGYHRESAAEAAYRTSQEAMDRVLGVGSRTVFSRTTP